MLPSHEALLAALKAEPHHARMKRMGTLGAQHAKTPGFDALLDDLSTGPLFEARLGLVAAAAAKDQARIAAALRSDSNALRGLAAHFALLLDDETLSTLLLSDSAEEALPEDTRRALLKAIGESRRQDLAEGLLDPVRTRHGSAEAAVLLLSCSAARVEAELPAFEHVSLRWSVLARRFTDVVAAYIAHALRSATRWQRAILWFALGPALEVLARERPRLVLTLADTCCPQTFLPDVVETQLGVLLAREPDATIALLCRAPYRPALEREGLPPAVLRRTAKLSDTQLTLLARALNGAHYTLAELLEELAPTRRGPIFEAAFDGVSFDGVRWPDPLLVALPHALRTREVERMLELPVIQAELDSQVHLWGFLPIEQVRARFVEAARASNADERGAALHRLCACAGRSRRGLSETLGFFCSRLENEQDPVRATAMSALAALPPSLYESAHTELLEALLKYALQARDTSYSTYWALQSLSLRLLQHAEQRALVDWALGALRQLAAQQGSLQLGELERLTPARSKLLLDTLVPVLRDKERRNHWTLTLLVAEAAGERGWTHVGLQERLERATRSKEAWTCRSAVRHWLAAPRTREDRVRVLLDRDPSFITLPEVRICLHTRRQDWLDPFLEGRPLEGRFGSGEVGFVPAFSAPFFRWTPAQQQRYSTCLSKISDDVKQTASLRSWAIKTQAMLEFLGHAAVASYVSSSEVSLAEAALGALPHLDTPEAALPLLVEQAGGPRARVAAYALLKVLRHSRPARVAETLAAIEAQPKLKLTTRKELIRLSARFRVPGTAERLWMAWAEPERHRDLRIASLHAAHGLLDEEAAWSMFEAAATHADRFVAEAAAGSARTLIPKARRLRYGRNVLALTRHDDQEVRRTGFRVLLSWASGMEAEVVARCVEEVRDFDSAVWRPALQALTSVVADGAGGEALERLAVSLATAEAGEGREASAKRDLPQSQRLVALCAGLTGLDGQTRAQLGGVLRGTAEALSNSGFWTWREVLGLRVAALDWEHVSETQLQALLDEACRWLEGFGVLRALIAGSLNDRSSWSVEAMEAHITALVASPSAGVALLALELLRARSARSGWSQADRAALRMLRRSQSPDVSTAAHRLWCAAEP